MNIEEIIAELRQERIRIDAALSALQADERTGRKAFGWASGKAPRRGPRRMSAEARARIAAAQRKRWAKVKVAQK